MSHYITCHNCGEPECMDSDTGVHRRDDGTVCPDPRDAEVEGLRADVARLTRERDELAVFRAAGHAETCDGMDEAEGRCACGYLQRQGAHAALAAAWAERDELARWRETHTVTPTIRIRAEAAEAEVARLKAEQAAAVCAWEEYARWPDLPSVPIGRVRLPDGREEEIALRPEQITGILRGIEKHVRQCLPYGVEAVKAWQDIGSVIAQRDAARAEVARLTRERDEARAASDKWQDRACDGWALQPGCHTGPGECPTYHDGCHCTRDVLIHNIARAESAEAEVARLRAAALPEDAIERGAKWLVENNADRYGRSWEDTPECQRDDARSTAAEMIAALRRDA